MLGDNKEIQAGDNSTNIQGQTVTVYGISYTEAKEIALQTFKENFYQLSEDAKNIATERAETLVKRFLGELQAESPELIRKIAEPDIQYAVINAQKQYARNGHAESLEVLSSLLKERFEIEIENSFRKIIINESIEAQSKLTGEQIRFISVLFIMKECNFTDFNIIFDVLPLILTDSWVEFAGDRRYLDHLISAGVAEREVIVGEKFNFEPILRNKYEGIPLDIVSPYSRDVKEDIKTKERYKIVGKRLQLVEKWNDSQLKGYKLTSIGISLAITFLNSVMSGEFDYKQWIRN